MSIEESAREFELKKRRAYMKKYREEHREKLNAYRRKYYAEHREEHQARYAKNRDKILAQRKKYRDANREELLAKRRKCYHDNVNGYRDKKLEYARARRAAKKLGANKEE